jgi:hypothetical protein
MKIRWIPAAAALALCLAASAQADVVINEVMASNGYYEDGHAWDWVELHNDGDKTVSLAGWGLTDSKKDLYKFTFPDGARLKAGEYLTIWCTGEENKTPGKGNVFYADFKISSAGETLRLTNSGEEEAGKVKLPEQYGCVSYGLPSGGGDYGFFENPTRGKKNDAEAFARRAEKPEIVTAAGFYEGSVTVKVVLPSALSTDTSPPWSSIIFCTTARPMPLPSPEWDSSA